MSHDRQFQQNNFQQSANFNPSAQQNFTFSSTEANPFEVSFKSQDSYPRTGLQGSIHNTTAASNNNNGDTLLNNNYTRSSTQEPSESGHDNSRDDEDSEARRKRFLERNRIAASKCRQKKKIWMQQLSSEADQAAARNKALQMMINQLKDEVLVLKNQLLAHRNCNCNVIQQYIQTSGQFASMNSQQPSNGSLPTEHGHPSMMPTTGSALDPLNNLPSHN